MRSDLDLRPLAFLIITFGCLLTFASAVVPFFDTGYELCGSVLFIGLLPYIIYGFFTDVVRGWALLIAGALMFGIDLGVKIPERFLRYDGYTSGAMYYASLFSTVSIIAILGIGARKERRWYGEVPPASNIKTTAVDTESEK